MPDDQRADAALPLNSELLPPPTALVGVVKLVPGTGGLLRMDEISDSSSTTKGHSLDLSSPCLVEIDLKVCPEGTIRKGAVRKFGHFTPHAPGAFLTLLLSKTLSSPEDATQEEGLCPRRCFSHAEAVMAKRRGKKMARARRDKILEPSFGSKNHSRGMCKPCRFMLEPNGCIKGSDCNFCHLTHDSAVFSQAPDPDSPEDAGDFADVPGEHPGTLKWLHQGKKQKETQSHPHGKNILEPSGGFKDAFTPEDPGAVVTAAPEVSKALAERRGKKKVQASRDKILEPSNGSKNHFSGMCRPCRLALEPNGCPRGSDCNFCHFTHDSTVFSQVTAVSDDAGAFAGSRGEKQTETQNQTNGDDILEPSDGSENHLWDLCQPCFVELEQIPDDPQDAGAFAVSRGEKRKENGSENRLWGLGQPFFVELNQVPEVPEGAGAGSGSRDETQKEAQIHTQEDIILESSDRYKDHFEIAGTPGDARSSTRRRQQKKNARARNRDLEPSNGSKNHSRGLCRPCRFELDPDGCPRGTSCNFCHFTHEDSGTVLRALLSKAPGAPEAATLPATKLCEG